MRVLPVVSLLLSVVALILGFLCIFAGSKPSFLGTYAILTLNTSRVGQNLLNTTTASSTSSNALSSLLQNLTSPLTTSVETALNDTAASLASRLGLSDFYSLHVLDYCRGDFTPSNSSHKSITACSNRTALFAFDARQALEQSLNSSGTAAGLDADQLLDDIGWPAELDRGLDALRTAFRAQFVLYCLGLAFAFLAFVAAALWAVRGGRLGACSDGLLALLGCLFLGIASAIATAVAVKGSSLVNKYGARVGIGALKGTGFLGLTWAATACLFFASVAGCVGIVGGRKNKVKPYQDGTVVDGEKR